MSTAEQHPPHEEFSFEDRRVIDWRFDQFRSLGFGEEDRGCSRSGADHFVRRSSARAVPRIRLRIVL
jgi:hypothetical protein